MGQSVDTGSGGDLPGQVLNQPGVQNHVVGNHVLVDDADFQLLLGHTHDGVGGDLRAGAGSGGNQHDGHTFFCHAGVVQQLLDAVLVGDQHAGQLGGVHDAAAAAGHNQVSAAALELIHDGLHRHIGRLGGQLVQHVVVHTGGLDHVLRQSEQAQLAQTLVGEHGHLFGVQGLDDGGNALHCVLAAVNGMGHFQIVGCQHSKSLLIRVYFASLAPSPEVGL